MKKILREHSSLVQLFLTFLIVLSFLSIIVENKSQYSAKNYSKIYPELKKTYENSQYVSKDPGGWIPDEIVLSYAGGALIKGENPTYIIPDAPPLGKYLIGLSTLIFDNAKVIMIFFGAGSLLMLFGIGKQIFKNPLTAFLPPLLVSFEPLFRNQLKYVPLLDLMQLFFLLTSFYMFNRGVNNSKYMRWFILAVIFIGFFISTKFYITGLTIAAAFLAVLVLNKKFKQLLHMLIVLPLCVVVLVLSYSRLFFLEYSLRDMIGVQKWIFLYHKTQLIYPLSIWPLILLNKWFVWYGNQPIISDPQWRITWPITLILSLIAIPTYIWKKIERKIEVEVLICWFAFYILFFSFGQITARYLVILFPVLYLVSIYLLEQIAIDKLPKKK